MQKWIIYGLAFVLPPFMVAILLAITSASETMIHKTPEPVQTPAAQEKPIALEKGRPKALILLSNAGVETTDLLATHEILAESGLFQTLTIAPQKVVTPTTGAVSVMPDLTLQEAPAADLLVIPAVLDPDNGTLISWVREHAPQARYVLVLGEGARLAAFAGILDHHQATSHFLAMDDLKRDPSAVQWISGKRYLQDQKIISSEGVSASPDAALHAVEVFSSRAQAEQTAQRLGYSWIHESHEQNLTRGDFFRLFMNAGFGWENLRSAFLSAKE